jgi:hypothetical protein
MTRQRATYPLTATGDHSYADHKNRAQDLGLAVTSTNACPRRLIQEAPPRP